MYTDFYKLSGRPFQLSPDSRFFFGSRSHKKAMAYLSFGLNEREGFIVITGDVGAGKTTLVGHLLSRLDRQKFAYGHVVTTQLEADDALRMVASAFGLPHKGVDKATLLRAIEGFLVDARQVGKHVLLIVDEVQNMPPSALEELRMLSNFQLDGKPLFQCFLLGQPQFRRIMASDDMEQLRQRVIASCHLSPLDADEVRDYIEHRLALVGWQGDPAFTDDAFPAIQAHTGGVPRRINNLCSRILLFGALEELHRIDASVVAQVARELAQEGTQHSSFRVASDVQPTPEPRAAAPAHPAPLVATPKPEIEPKPVSLPPSAGHEETIFDLQQRVRFLQGRR
jgi:putative secretion ATPase (PEP-CTERM system associated)